MPLSVSLSRLLQACPILLLTQHIKQMYCCVASSCQPSTAPRQQGEGQHSLPSRHINTRVCQGKPQQGALGHTLCKHAQTARNGFIHQLFCEQTRVCVCGGGDQRTCQPESFYRPSPCTDALTSAVVVCCTALGERQVVRGQAVHT